MTDILKLQLPGKPQYVSTVRMVIASLANSVGFDVEAIEDMKVAVSEACTNAVCHGGSGENLYEVSFELSDEQLCICVQDQGEGYDMNEYQKPDLDCPKEGGLGLFIIQTLMDEVESISEPGKGTKIRMVKYRP
ncbi:MAG: ATP-binding protein [Firmicutes bacterium]|nr:ATP-binding protein [Bacillota bacterium]